MQRSVLARKCVKFTKQLVCWVHKKFKTTPLFHACSIVSYLSRSVYSPFIREGLIRLVVQLTRLCVRRVHFQNGLEITVTDGGVSIVSASVAAKEIFGIIRHTVALFQWDSACTRKKRSGSQTTGKLV